MPTPTPTIAGPAPARPAVLDDFLAPDRNSFGVIRLAMAVAVLFSHSFLFHAGTTSADPLYQWTGHTLGEHAVQVFFFLSGILIAQSFDKSRSLLAFAAARVLRIFPALVVVVLLAAFLLGPLVATVGAREYFASPLLAAYVWKTIALVTGSAPLPGVFETLPLAGRVNMSLWTLKYEVICYIGVAALGLLGLFRARWRWLATLLLAVAVAGVFVGEPKPATSYTFLDNTRYFALYFFMGTLAYLARSWLEVRPLLLVPFACLFAAALGTRYAELAGALLIGYGTIVVAARTWSFLTPFCRQHDWSYGVYIYAAPIQQALLQLVPGIEPMALSCFALAMTMPLAWASWELVEKPAIALRQRLTGSRAAEIRRAEAHGTGARGGERRFAGAGTVRAGAVLPRPAHAEPLPARPAPSVASRPATPARAERAPGLLRRFASRIARQAAARQRSPAAAPAMTASAATAPAEERHYASGQRYEERLARLATSTGQLRTALHRDIP